MNVFWAVLLERSTLEIPMDSLLDVAAYCGYKGFMRLSEPYQRTDTVRNHFCRQFMENSSDPDDVLVMLDNDHWHPHHVVFSLAQHNLDVVGALAFRRGPPYDPCFYIMRNNQLFSPTEWSGQLFECDIVGHGAVAIKRRVLTQLEYPFYKYEYPAFADFEQSEEIFFGLECMKRGIKHHCDTGLVIPHLTYQGIDDAFSRAYRDAAKKDIRDHPFDVPSEPVP